MQEADQMPDGRRDVLEGLTVACIQLSRCQTVCQMVEAVTVDISGRTATHCRWSNFFT